MNDRPTPIWHCLTATHRAFVHARDNSEARSRVKAAMGIGRKGRLPAGTLVTRLDLPLVFDPGLPLVREIAAR